MVSVLLLGTVCSGNQRRPVVSDWVAQTFPRLLVEKCYLHNEHSGAAQGFQ